ncbi:phasin family protein [Massilia glaciei]|nr:phasin family protein [Massilia glaciei]
MQATPNSRAMRSQMESQMNFMNELTATSVDSLRKLSELNMHWAQQFVEGALNTSRQLLACSDHYQVGSTMMGQIQPTTERIRHYQEQLMNVIAGAQLDLTRAAEAHMPEAGRGAAAALAGALLRPAAAATERAAPRREGATFDTWSGPAFAGGSGRPH